MASTHKHIRSGTANKRPTTAIAEGQIALATNITSPGLFFKDSTGATIVKIGPVHVGATAPNVSPAGSAGNSIGEVWLDTSLTPVGVKIWDGSAFVNATPIGSTTVQGLLELATDAETQAGADTARAVTPASLQSKLSDSTSTTSNTTIASSTAVKAAYDLANAALPKTGGTVTGNLEIGTAGSLSFEGATADGFETTIAITDPTADRTITLPNTTGTVVTTGDSGTVTSTMILDGTIVDADINASAEISVSKLVDGSARQLLQTDAAGTGVEWASNIDIPGTLDVTSAATFDSTVAVTGALTKSGSNVVTVGDTGTVTSTMILDGTILNSDVNASAAIAYSKLASLTSANILVGNSSNVATSTAVTGDVTISNAGVTAIAAGVIVNADVNASAAIVDTKLATIATAGKVSNSATTATNANTASAIVARDASGNFTAGTITAALTGAASSNVLKAGDTMTGALVHPLGAVGTPSITFTGDLNTGIYSPTADTLAFVEGGSEAMRIDSTGRLLVGTSTTVSTLIDAGLQVQGTGANAYISSGRWGATASASALIFNKSRGATVGTRAIVQADDVLGEIIFTGDDGTNFVRGANIVAHVDGTPGTNDMPGRLVFSTTADGASSSTERMRITSAGLVGIGISTPGAALHVQSGLPQVFLSNSASTAADKFAHICGLQRANDTEPEGFSIIGAGGTSAENTVYIGGFFGEANASTSVQFFTAANNTTRSGTERARIDSSGRLLVGTSTNRSSRVDLNNFQAALQIESNTEAAQAVTRWSADLSGSRLHLQKGRGTIASPTAVIAQDSLGEFSFSGYDGANMTNGARISAFVDGTPGANDMPGRLVFNTTADGAESPTEALRITNDRVIAYNQPTPTSKSAAATLTITELKTGIIQYTGAVATLTLPTGTLMEGGFSGIYTNMAFEWSIINTGSGICTVAAGTDHTVIGSGTVAIGASARFVSRRTAANTFVSYRLS